MIYLDHHSTSPPHPAAVAAMRRWWSDDWANPHSDHAAGREVAAAHQTAAEQLAGLVGVSADRMVFTSGATESVNLAIRGFATHPRQRRRQILVSSVEHPCVLEVADSLAVEGFEVSRLPVDPNGRIDLDVLNESLTDQTALVSVGLGNNEIGTLDDVSAIAAVARDRGAVVHVDGTQSFGRLPIDVVELGADLLSASAHKIGGPPGVGLLAVGGAGRRVRLRPLIVGGGQQGGLRGGTVNAAGVIAFAAAATADRDTTAVANHRDELWRRLSAAVTGLELNGPPLTDTDRLPGNLNVRLPGVEGAGLMADCPTVAFSTGSACSSTSDRPSHVLRAIGLSDDEARRSVRFGLDETTTEAEIVVAVERLAESYRRLTAGGVKGA